MFDIIIYLWFIGQADGVNFDGYYFFQNKKKVHSAVSNQNINSFIVFSAYINCRLVKRIWKYMYKVQLTNKYC